MGRACGYAAPPPAGALGSFRRGKMFFTPLPPGVSVWRTLDLSGFQLSKSNPRSDASGIFIISAHITSFNYRSGKGRGGRGRAPHPEAHPPVASTGGVAVQTPGVPSGAHSTRLRRELLTFSPPHLIRVSPCHLVSSLPSAQWLRPVFAPWGRGFLAVKVRKHDGLSAHRYGLTTALALWPTDCAHGNDAGITAPVRINFLTGGPRSLGYVMATGATRGARERVGWRAGLLSLNSVPGRECHVS